MPNIYSSSFFCSTILSQMSTEYDYVIIGGGTAGLVVAARLSEDASKKVAVIEAGSNRKGDPRIDIPGLALSLYEDTDYDWSFLTEPQVSLVTSQKDSQNTC